MTTPYPKRLIEVDLPIRRISAHARREKSIRHGHLSTLHIWWARRPLAACRAVICAALWPDPADELCPQPFRDAVARLLPAVERVRYLFGVEGVKQPARRGKREAQMSLFEAMGKEEAEAAGWTMDDDLAVPAGRTVLDRVHQSMLLFAAGRSNALKRYLVDEGIGKDERFWSLAQALSALYPSHTDEKRWVDGVLARKKGLGF